MFEVSLLHISIICAFVTKHIIILFFCSCVGVQEHQASDIEIYHCPSCQMMNGPLVCKYKEDTCAKCWGTLIHFVTHTLF